MALGPFAFEALGFGLQDISSNLQTPWADIAVAQTLNQQQWTGPTSEEIAIKGVLFPEEFGGGASLAGIKSAAKAGTPLFLVSGDAAAGFVGGQFTVQSVTEDKGFIDRLGRAHRNAYQIALKRYQSAGSGGFIRQVIDILW